MSTFAEMQANIASFLRRSDLGSEIPVAITRAIAHYENEDWPWNEARSTSLVTVAETKTVALPTRFRSDIQLLIDVNSYVYALCKATQQEIERLYISNTYFQQPSIYSIWDDNIYLYPIPDAAYTLTFNYYEGLAVLSSGSDTNAWTTTAEALIEARAIWWLAARVMRNPEVAAAAKDDELTEYQQLRRQATLRASSGRIRTVQL